MYKEPYDTCECEHSPNKAANKWKAFIEYLLRKEKYYWRDDSSAICAKCGAHIRTPKLFRSPWILLIYGIAVILITIGVFWPLLKIHVKFIPLLLLYILTWAFFDRAFVAAIFALGKWPKGEDTDNRSRRDAFWGNSRLIFGCVCARCTLTFMMTCL